MELIDSSFMLAGEQVEEATRVVLVVSVGVGVEVVVERRQFEFELARGAQLMLISCCC